MKQFEKWRDRWKILLNAGKKYTLPLLDKN